MDNLNSWFNAIRISVLAASLSFLGACATAGNGGAGAAAEVKGNIHDTNERAQEVLKNMHVQLINTETKDSGNVQILGGNSGEEDVSIEMTSSGGDTTHVQVTAKKGTFSWDKDYANQILSKIVQG